MTEQRIHKKNDGATNNKILLLRKMSANDLKF